jgi:hypothetical protein
VSPCLSAGGGSSPATPVTPAPTVNRCDTANTSTEALAIIRECGSINLDLDGLFALGNHSVAAKAEIDKFCKPSCLSAFNTAIRVYSECFPEELQTSISIVNSMCESHDGEYCAWRLRAVDQLTTCDDEDSRNNNQSRCEANTTANRYCRWSNKSSECGVVTTPALLQQACTPCYDRFVFLIARFLRQSFGSNPTPEQLDTLQLAQSMLTIQKNYYCAKHEQTWCQPLVEGLDERVYNIDPRNNVSLATVRENISNVCTSTGKVCLNKVAGAQVDLLREYTDLTYRACMRAAASQRFQSWRVNAETQCISNYRHVYNAVARVAVDLTFMCRKNAQTGNNSWCNPLAHEYVRHPCFSVVEGSKQCNATCATWLAGETTRLGCCWDRFAELSFESQYPDTVGLPVRVAATFDAAPASGRNYTHNPGRSTVEICANVSDNGFNATAARAQISAMCPTVAAVRKELRLVGVRWNRFAANATLKAIMEAALRADMARTLGVAASAVVNGTLAADETQSLTSGAGANASASASASASRRQDSSSTAGTKFDFQLVLDSSDDTAAAGARFDTAKSTNSIQATTTASALTNECSDCVGSPTAAPGETAAPPPTGNLFAAIVGAPADGSTSPPASSGAVGVAASLAGFAAAMLVVVA